MIINAAIVVFEIIATPIVYKEVGSAIFVYYTVNSNYFLAIASVLVFIYSIPVLQGKKDSLPAFVSTIKYMATCVVTVTFLVVVFILTPTTIGSAGVNDTLWKNLLFLLLHGSMLYMHFICPLLAIYSYTVLEKRSTYEKRLPLLGMIFTVVYAAVLIPLNALAIVRGPYPFLMVRDQSILASVIWTVAIMSFAYLIAFTINLASKKH